MPKKKITNIEKSGSYDLSGKGPRKPQPTAERFGQLLDEHRSNMKSAAKEYTAQILNERASGSRARSPDGGTMEDMLSNRYNKDLVGEKRSMIGKFLEGRRIRKELKRNDQEQFKKGKTPKGRTLT